MKMPIYLYFNYYRDQDSDRRKELLGCVNTNLKHNFIAGYKIFLENNDHSQDLPKDDRIEYILLDKRMQFSDAINHAYHSLPSNSVVIIINLDIYLANSNAWANIDDEFFLRGHPHKAMVCTRVNLTNDPSKSPELGKEARNWHLGNYCDAYVFQTPFLQEFLNEDFDFCPGTPQCDNTMMYLMTQHYHTYSWGSKYQIVHVDLCRQQRGEEKKYPAGPAAQRRREHRDIPTQQCWQQLLDSKREPIWTWTWFDIKRCV
jgi:hypothetical protein